MTIKERMQAPTPPFFEKLRDTGLYSSLVSVLVIVADVPLLVEQVAANIAVAGLVMALVSQCVTVDHQKPSGNSQNKRLFYG